MVRGARPGIDIDGIDTGRLLDIVPGVPLWSRRAPARPATVFPVCERAGAAEIDSLFPEKPRTRFVVERAVAGTEVDRAYDGAAVIVDGLIARRRDNGIVPRDCPCLRVPVTRVLAALQDPDRRTGPGASLYDTALDRDGDTAAGAAPFGVSATMPSEPAPSVSIYLPLLVTVTGPPEPLPPALPAFPADRVQTAASADAFWRRC